MEYAPARECLRGGTGIRVRLRTVLPQGIAGSNPAGGKIARVAQAVEHDHGKIGVASASLASGSHYSI